MNIQWRSGAVTALTRTPEVRVLLDKEAGATRDRARRNAAPIVNGSTGLLRAIVAEPAVIGEDGYEAKVGYDKTQEGFVLWWAEVGTVHQPATPHLRPAVRRGRPA